MTNQPDWLALTVLHHLYSIADELEGRGTVSTTS